MVNSCLRSQEDTLPSIIQKAVKKSIKSVIPTIIAEGLNASVPDHLFESHKQIHKSINALNKLEARRFCQLQKATKPSIQKHVKNQVGEAAAHVKTSKKTYDECVESC